MFEAVQPTLRSTEKESFPLETEFYYDSDYDSDEYHGDINKVVGENRVWFEWLAKQIAQFPGDFAEFKKKLTDIEPELSDHVNEVVFTAIKDITSAFSELADSTQFDAQKIAVEKLSTLHQSTLRLGQIKAGEFPFLRTIPNYNTLYLSTIIVLINTRQQELRAQFSGRVFEAELAKFYKKISSLPFFRMSNGPVEKAKSDEQAFAPENLKNYISDVIGGISHLHYLAENGEQDEYMKYKRELAQLVGKFRRMLSANYSKNKQGEAMVREFNQKLSAELKKKGFTSEKLQFTGINNKAAKEKRLKEEKQKLIDTNLTQYLVSTKDYVVYLHRTSYSAAKQICDTGFATGGFIGSTATSTSDEIDLAIRIYQQRHKDDDAVVIIRVPRGIDPDDSRLVPTESVYSSDGKKSSTPVISPSWVYGYILREDTTLETNPHFGDAKYDKIKPPVTWKPKIA